MEEEKKQNGLLPVDAPTDLAGKSLADAFRLSFRLLSFFMVIVLVLFLLTGLSQIQPNERGIRLLFGKIQGEGMARVLEKGLAWSLPEPVGRVEKIPTGKQQLEIDDFWPHETAKEALIPISERQAPRDGLRPGWDGALLTGDRALVHVKFVCYYRVGFRDNKPNAEAVVDYVSNIIDADDLVRSVVCNAAIRVASTVTVDLILTAGKVSSGKDDGKQATDKKDEFSEAIAKLGQQQLDKLQSGISISSVEIESRIPPLAARAAFVAVTTAINEKDMLIHNAVGEANTILQNAIGEAWKDLVEDPTGLARTSKRPLLKRYAEAREKGDNAQADKLLKEINYLLVSTKTKGEASEIIEDARRYKNSVVARVKSSAETFNKLLPTFNISPKLMVTRQWADVKEKILTSKTMSKFYLTPGQKFILKLGRDPNIANRIARELMKMQTEQQRENRPGQRRP